MKNHNLASELIGRTINRFILRVFPPFAEVTLSAADISVQMEMDNERWYLINIDNSDNWSAQISRASPPTNVKEWSEFDYRMGLILSGELEPDYNYEFYDAAKAAEFSEIVNKRICSAFSLKVPIHENPFGIKFELENDFILLYANTDGCAIETKQFKQGRGLNEFASEGEIVYSKLG